MPIRPRPHPLPAALALALGLLLAVPARAHLTWLLPVQSHVDGKEATIAFDAAVSEDLFHFERALKLDTVLITGPDGQPRELANRSAARHRESFDLKLVADGSYRISHVSRGVMASWREGEQTRRFRGTPEAFAKEVPADQVLQGITLTHARQQTFVSKERAGQPRFTAEGQGLEVLPLDAASDLSVGDTTRLRLLLDGRPLPGATLKLLREGNRYRYKMGEELLTSDAEGVVTLRWAEAGRYFLGASHGDRPAAAAPGAAPAQAGTRDKPLQRAGLSVTFEVLPR